MICPFAFSLRCWAGRQTSPRVRKFKFAGGRLAGGRGFEDLFAVDGKEDVANENGRVARRRRAAGHQPAADLRHSGAVGCIRRYFSNVEYV